MAVATLEVKDNGLAFKFTPESSVNSDDGQAGKNAPVTSENGQAEKNALVTSENGQAEKNTPIYPMTSDDEQAEKNATEYPVTSDDEQAEKNAPDNSSVTSGDCPLESSVEWTEEELARMKRQYRMGICCICCMVLGCPLFTVLVTGLIVLVKMLQCCLL